MSLSDVLYGLRGRVFLILFALGDQIVIVWIILYIGFGYDDIMEVCSE